MPTAKTPVAVRNVILVAGYDYEVPNRSFGDLAIERILELFDQKEHLRYPLRFHLLSIASGLVAESVVFDKTYAPSARVAPLPLEIGPFWMRVEPRFAPVTNDAYGIDKVFHAPRNRAPGDKREMSITDIYCYLHSFWEAASNTSPENLVAFDSILELSLFAHATVDAIRLVNSVDARPRSSERDKLDNDARVKDLTRFPSRREATGFWSQIREVFDRGAGRVRIWGSDANGDTPYHAALIRAALAARALAVRATPTSSLPATISDDDLIATTDPLILSKLGSGASRLALVQVKTILSDALAASYASALQGALKVSLYTAPLGAVTAPEQHPPGPDRRRLLAVPDTDQDIANFHASMLKLLIDRENRRYGVLGRAPQDARKDPDATSPLAGIQLFEHYRMPFAIDASDKSVIRRGPARQPLANKLANAVEAALKPYYVKDGVSRYSLPDMQKLPAIAIADVSGTAPYPYAATPNDDVPYYSASLLKAAALFSTGRLLKVVGDLSEKGLKGSPTRDVLALLAPCLDGVIDRAADFGGADVIQNGHAATLEWKHRVPDYRNLLSMSAPPWDINKEQAANIDKIFRDPNRSNGAALKFIHGLGYAWINAVMRLSGFPGIWLAGDYSGATQWPSATIASSNDGPVAQATTARDMAALFAVIAREGLVETAKMRTEWLSLGRGWLDDRLQEAPTSGFSEVGAKVGLGPLKNSNFVWSEAAIVVQDTIPRTFVVVWQNCLKKDLPRVVSIVRAALEHYAG